MTHSRAIRNGSHRSPGSRYICQLLRSSLVYPTDTSCRNATAPRLASSSKDCTVRVWSTSTRRVEYTLGGHTASVNVVKWGGVGKGVLYTASSDRTVRVWDASTGRLLHTLKDHAHWVTTLTLNTDFVLRTGPFDYRNQKPKSEEEGVLSHTSNFHRETDINNSKPNLWLYSATMLSLQRPLNSSSQDRTTTRCSFGPYSPHHLPRPRKVLVVN